jgi:hypothetical protein
MTKAECSGWQDNSRLVAIFAGGGDSNLPSFGQLQGQAPGFEVGASGDPGFWMVNFVTEESGMPDQASEQFLKQRRIRIGM